MPGSAYRDRTFPAAEVRRILRQAAELDLASRAPPGAGRGHTLEEIERIARDAGISDAALRRAVAGEVAPPRAPRQPFSLLPAPAVVSVERTARGAVDASLNEEVVKAIGRAAGVLGDARSKGDSLRWSSAATGGRRVDAIVEPAGDGRMTVRVEENLRATRASIFSGTLAATLLLLLPILAAVASSSYRAVPLFLLVWPLVAYLAAWIHYGRRFARREAQLRALVADVFAVIEAGNGPRSTLEGVEGRARIARDAEYGGEEDEEDAAGGLPARRRKGG